MKGRGNSLVVQWLGLGSFIATGWGLIPGRGTKILQSCKLRSTAEKENSEARQ